MTLECRNTHYWRWQEGTPKTYLSTIEAIYYFMMDLHDIFISSEPTHQYDNLLFFFCYLYSKISNASKGGKGIKSYERDQIQNKKSKKKKSKQGAHPNEFQTGLQDKLE